MWGFQRGFRLDVEMAVEHTLEELDVVVRLLSPASARRITPFCYSYQ